MKPKLPSFYKKYQILEKNELNNLCLKAQSGCLESRNRIIECNLGLIPQHAYRATYLNNPTITFEDMFEQGVLGLFDAIKGFDVSSGFAFSTYALFWIKQRMQRYTKDHAHTIRIPVYAQAIRSRYEQIKKQNTDKDDEFWLNLLCVETKNSPENIQWILDYDPSISSLDKVFNENDDGESVLQISYDLFDDEYHEGLDYEHIVKIINFLPSFEKKILLRYYEGNTLNVVAKEFNYSREGIRLIINNSLHKLRALVKLKVRVK